MLSIVGEKAGRGNEIICHGGVGGAAEGRLLGNLGFESVCREDRRQVAFPTHRELVMRRTDPSKFLGQRVAGLMGWLCSPGCGVQEEPTEVAPFDM